MATWKASKNQKPELSVSCLAKRKRLSNLFMSFPGIQGRVFYSFSFLSSTSFIWFNFSTRMCRKKYNILCKTIAGGPIILWLWSFFMKKIMFSFKQLNQKKKSKFNKKHQDEYIQWFSCYLSCIFGHYFDIVIKITDTNFFIQIHFLPGKNPRLLAPKFNLFFQACRKRLLLQQSPPPSSGSAHFSRASEVHNGW